MVVIDGTQSVGALDFPFDEVRPDAVMCAAYKWLMGPYGLALGWFGDVLQDGEPIEETWAGRRGSEDFRGLADYTDAYGPGSVRFDVGQRSNFITLPMAIEALRLVKGWGTGPHPGACASLWAPVLRARCELRDTRSRTRPGAAAPGRRAAARGRGHARHRRAPRGGPCARLVAGDVHPRVATPVQHSRGHAGAHRRTDGQCVIARRQNCRIARHAIRVAAPILCQSEILRF